MTGQNIGIVSGFARDPRAAKPLRLRPRSGPKQECATTIPAPPRGDTAGPEARRRSGAVSDQSSFERRRDEATQLLLADRSRSCEVI